MSSVVDFASVDVCSLWAAPEDVFGCCPDLTQSDEGPVNWAITQASDLLYHLSGDRYPGTCTATVRPCTSHGSCWRPVDDVWHASTCSCQRLSKIRLAGYPVQAITQITIDGVVLDPTEYTLYYQRELVRMADADGNPQRWPACQRLDIASGDGTFFVAYTYGQSPPAAGISAAAQLACEILRQCPGTVEDGEGECNMPSGLVRITRQGLTIDSQALGVWLLGSLRTGLPLVDAFLSVYGRKPGVGRVALSTPEMDPWPIRVE